MKFKEHSSSAVKVGDIKSNEVSIDIQNLDFVMTILSSGLYSNPIPSLIREIVSNAWDSHVEARNTIQPVVLELGQNSEGQHFCKIQDFGVGLSPERFDKVYRKIGSSTKRGTNGQLGGFGLGKFAPLSYTNVVRITSYHDGTEYLYLMNKENNKLNIDLLYSKPTTAANGVSVEIDIKSYDVQKFVQAIESQLAYFNNLVVIESIEGKPYNLEQKFNNFKIKNYDNFCVNTLNSVHPTILLGKVNYPIRFSDLKKSYSSHVMNCYPIAIKFDIGDIGVTPNREELLYTTESIQAIEDKLDASIQEIEDLFIKQNNKDYQDLNEFIADLQKSDDLILAEDDSTVIRIHRNSTDRKMKFKGKQYSPSAILSILNIVRSYNCKFNFYRLTDRRSLTLAKGYYSYISDLFQKKNVYLTDVSELKTHSKAYIRETFSVGSIFFKEVNKRRLTKDLIKYINTKSKYNSHDFASVKLVLQYLEYTYNSFVKFSNADVPKQFIEGRKAAARANRSSVKRTENYWKQNVNLEYKDTYGSFDTDNFKLKDLNTKFKQLTVYSFKGDPRLENLNNVFKKVKFVGIAPTKMKLLKDLSNFVNVDNFMDKKYKAIRNLATVVYLKKKIPNLITLNENVLLSNVSKRLYDVITELNKFCYDNQKGYSDSDLHQEIYEYCKENNAFNEEILGLYNANKKEIKGLDVFALIDTINIGGYGTDTERAKLINLITDYALGRKLFRPDIEAVKKLKKETILNIKN